MKIMPLEELSALQELRLKIVAMATDAHDVYVKYGPDHALHRLRTLNEVLEVIDDQLGERP